MATDATTQTAEQVAAPAVASCYDVLDVAPAGGVTDFTDGTYLDDRNDRAGYLAAQIRQADYLLDQAHCRATTRLLDIGCGYGRILEQAVRRGATPVGITIAPAQVARVRARGLTALELNYRDIFLRGTNEWEGAFDAVIANGSLEHFVQPADAAADRTEAIYEELFAICRRLLKPNGRFVTTAIHFRDVGQLDPNGILRGPYVHPAGSAAYHFAMVLERTFGGWYPEPGQLERCAAPYFELVAEEDGTHDYHLTSEYWLQQLTWSTLVNPRVWWALAQKWWQSPRTVTEMLRCQIWDQSWAWQFRPPAPTRLWRQTWATK